MSSGREPPEAWESYDGATGDACQGLVSINGMGLGTWAWRTSLIMLNSSVLAPIAAADRRRFLAGGLATLALALSGRPALAAGARTGPWCATLTKAARENIYDFSLPLLDHPDELFTLSELTGKPTWLQFFASWCPPCNAEAADINRIARKYGDAIHLIGIDVKEKPEPVRAYRDRHAIAYPIALDSTGSIFKGFGFTGFPTHMFLDGRGLASCLSVGDLTPEQMDNEIAAALERPAAGPSAKP